MMMRAFSLVSLSLALTGCSVFERDAAPADPRMATEFAPAVSTTALGAAGHAPAALDKTSDAEKAAALSAPAAGGEVALGKAVAALGPPAQAGLWVESALIKAPGQGRVVAPNGQSLALELRPGSGGALLSLSAYQALGIALTDLPEIAIYAK